MLMAALLLTMAAMFSTSSTALSQVTCCRFGINNTSGCTIRACAVNGGGIIQCFDITPGAHIKPLGDPCPTFRLQVRDACGDLHFLPEVIGECLVIQVKDPANDNICCVSICYNQDCRWTITPSNDCVPCD